MTRLNDPLHGQEDPTAYYLDTWAFDPKPGRRSALKRRSREPYNPKFHFRPRWCAACRQWTTYMGEWRQHSQHWKQPEPTPVERALAIKAKREAAPLIEAAKNHERAMRRYRSYESGSVGRCPACHQDAPIDQGIILEHAEDYDTTCHAGPGLPPEPYTPPMPKPLDFEPPRDTKPAPPWAVPPPGTSSSEPMSMRGTVWAMAVVLAVFAVVVYLVLTSGATG
jgi:hypothetical protein